MHKSCSRIIASGHEEDYVGDEVSADEDDGDSCDADRALHPVAVCIAFVTARPGTC